MECGGVSLKTISGLTESISDRKNEMNGKLLTYGFPFLVIEIYKPTAYFSENSHKLILAAVQSGT